MKILYKILFEVKVLHEYYHTDTNRESVFDVTRYPTQQDRMNFLLKRFEEDQPSVNGNVQFVLPSSMQDRLKNQHMVLLQSYSGFLVAVSVKEITLAGGAVAYAPVIPLDDNFNIVVLMNQLGGQFNRLTNGRSNRSVKSLYYFSNEKISGPKTAPVLSTAIAGKDNTYEYEQGELSNDGTSICIYYNDSAGNHFPAIIGNGFANENDRLIVTPRFDYTFEATDGVTDAQFSLKDQQGNLLRTISVSRPEAIDSIALNFYGENYNLVTLPQAGITDPLLYTLEVTGNAGYSRITKLIFYEAQEEVTSAWGVIQIQAKVSNNTFNLLDQNGYINKPALPDGSTAPYPIFEIRCKSRFTFWKYSNDAGSPLQLTTNLENFLNPGADASELVSLAPFPSTFLPYYIRNLKDTNDAALYFLPNPIPDTSIETKNKQLFSHIRVPDSKLFPVA